MDGGNAADAVNVGLQHFARVQAVGLAELKLHEHGHRLQIVFDAVVHFTHNGRIGHQPRIFNGQRRLVGQGGKQRLLLLAELARFGGVAVKHANHPVPHAERYRQHGDEPFLSGQFFAPIARIGLYVGNVERLPRLQYAADDAVGGVNRQGRAVLVRRLVAAGGAKFQVGAGFVEQEDGADGRIHHLCRHFRDHIQNIIQILWRCNHLADLRQGAHLFNLALLFVIKLGFGQRPGGNITDERQQGNLVAAEIMGRASLHIHRTKHIAFNV